MNSAIIYVMFLTTVATDVYAQEFGQADRPVIAISHLSKSTFKIVVVNTTDKEIQLGELHSALGFDQFVFIAISKGGNNKIFLKRKSLKFTHDRRVPIVVPRGSFCEFEIDFGDQSWSAENGSVISVEHWKALTVVYDPKNCELKQVRKECGIWGHSFSTEIELSQ